jgi:hypothetical protein
MFFIMAIKTPMYYGREVTRRSTQQEKILKSKMGKAYKTTCERKNPARLNAAFVRLSMVEREGDDSA